MVDEYEANAVEQELNDGLDLEDVVIGFCPLCVVKCVVKLIARSHLLRLFDFSPVCSLSVFSNAITGRLQSHTSCIFSIFRCDSVS